MSPTYTSEELELGLEDDEFTRADIEFHGVDHSGPSFEARVFLNNPGATTDSDTTAETGYAGTFHIFGHGGCFGDDEGHCEATQRRAYDPRPEHPLTRATKVVIATDAVRQALHQGGPVTVTVVPVVTGTTEECSTDDIFDVEHIDIVAYD